MFLVLTHLWPDAGFFLRAVSSFWISGFCSIVATSGFDIIVCIFASSSLLAGDFTVDAPTPDWTL